MVRGTVSTASRANSSVRRIGGAKGSSSLGNAKSAGTTVRGERAFLHFGGLTRAWLTLPFWRCGRSFGARYSAHQAEI